MNQSTQDLLKAASKELLTTPKTGHSELSKHRQMLVKGERRGSSGLWARPFHSDALGVSPEQIPQAMESLREHGVNAEFDPETGACIVTSDKQFREIAKACGLWDGAQGYCAGRNDDGSRIHSGRDPERAKEEFRKAVERGDYD